ncbi:transport between ER and Golgi ATPase protein [Tulasnella sp. 403]|nr:transport between ER and Golgi ATPase protein [Tulasnella sp. 403]
MASFFGRSNQGGQPPQDPNRGGYGRVPDAYGSGSYRGSPTPSRNALIPDGHSYEKRSQSPYNEPPQRRAPPSHRGAGPAHAQGDEVDITPLDLTSADYLQGLDLEVAFWKKGQQVAEQYDSDEMAHNLIKAFNGQIFSVGQIVVFDFHGQNLRGIVKGVQLVELPQQRGGMKASGTFGVLMEKTDITLAKASDSLIKLKGSAKKAAPNAIIAPNFKFEDMGIGGLDSEFGAIFRRAFASRVFPPGLVEKLGIQHVKGILLHGPPGTGKTLMARQIGKMLNAREPKIVNGPEILNKYVGASEENIRKLFADAEKEYKDKGDESGLHIIIFDELDAICKQRGSTNSGTGVGDSVVNQLLSKMDGVDQLNNVLIIGMTNRIDMIDEALLRPGRLEVHMEISLPDENGRLQILTIHTAKMRNNKVMDRDVSLQELAGLTKNFSGAEINGLVKSATSFAFNRHVKVGTMAGISDDIENLRVNRQDFMMALDEVHPAFGVSEEELQQVLVSPDSMVGYNEASKIAAIHKVFSDSYKSPLSVVVVDNIERLLEWVPIGPRFSNGVLQTLMVLLAKRPPKGRRLLIIATTSVRPMITDTQMAEIFDSQIRVPPVASLQSLETILREVELFRSSDERRRAMTMLQQAGFAASNTLNVGIKKLLGIVEMARQEQEDGRAERLVTELRNLDF